MWFPFPKEDVDEYVKLGHEEQQRRLQSIIKKIDSDSDGLLTESKDCLAPLTMENALYRLMNILKLLSVGFY